MTVIRKSGVAGEAAAPGQPAPCFPGSDDIDTAPCSGAGGSYVHPDGTPYPSGDK